MEILLTREYKLTFGLYSYIQLLYNCIHIRMLFLQMGNTPLHVALQSGHYHSNKVVEALIKGGADVNVTNKVSN